MRHRGPREEAVVLLQLQASNMETARLGQVGEVCQGQWAGVRKQLEVGDEGETDILDVRLLVGVTHDAVS